MWPDLEKDEADAVEATAVEAADIVRRRRGGWGGWFDAQCGIVYCNSTNDCEKMATFLKEYARGKSKHWSVEAYHAKLEPQRRTKVQNDWSNDVTSVVRLRWLFVGIRWPQTGRWSVATPLVSTNGVDYRVLSCLHAGLLGAVGLRWSQICRWFVPQV